MAKETTEKHALVSWKIKLDMGKGPSDDYYFSSYKDGIEREPLAEKIRVAINIPREISGYVEESNIEWAKLQLLIERQKFLIEVIGDFQRQLSNITSLLELEWGRLDRK